MCRADALARMKKGAYHMTDKTYNPDETQQNKTTHAASEPQAYYAEAASSPAEEILLYPEIISLFLLVILEPPPYHPEYSFRLQSIEEYFSWPLVS